MVFAEFQKWSTGWNGRDYSGPKQPIPMLGTDGVFVLDGRKSIGRQLEDAQARIKQLSGLYPGIIIGFKLFSGSSFLNCSPLLKGVMIPVTPTETV
jgi:hypothetical protein